MLGQMWYPPMSKTILLDLNSCFDKKEIAVTKFYLGICGVLEMHLLKFCVYDSNVKSNLI